jgi:hypothetical protein
MMLAKLNTIIIAVLLTGTILQVGGGRSGQLPNKALIAPQEVTSVAFAARNVNSNSE